MNNQKRSIYSLCLYAQDRLKTCVDQALLILVHSAIDAAEAGSLHNGHECHYYILFFIILTGFFFFMGQNDCRTSTINRNQHPHEGLQVKNCCHIYIMDPSTNAK